MRFSWKSLLIGKWTWMWSVVMLVELYLCLTLLAFFFTDRLLFIPPPSSYGKDWPGLIHLKSSAGEEIAAWWSPPQSGRPVILYAHGNAEDIGQNVDLFETWTSEGFGVLAYDYPGYGLSGRSASVEGCERAAFAAWIFLQNAGVSSDSLCIVGRSVGSGPSVWLAEQVRPAGLVLISPFKSVYSVPFRIGIFPWDHFQNLKRLRTMTTPLLVIHGESDTVIPAAHGRALVAASAAEEKDFVGIPNADHNDLFSVAGEEILDAIQGFIQEHVARESRSPN